MRTIDKIITKVSGKYGAPIGRSNVLPQAYSIVDTGRKFLANPFTKESKRIFDCAVPMNGAYDRGGAYWGLSSRGEGMGQLRVEYTKDLTYIKYYRK